MVSCYTLEMARNLDDYIVGFVDGEGCFAFSFRRDVRHERRTRKIYYSWKAMFVIELRSDDTSILILIQDRLKCGRITQSNQGRVARYQVADLHDLQDKIIPFFTAHVLIGKKGQDFLLWREAVNILYTRKLKKVRQSRIGVRGFSTVPYSEGEIERLKELYERMRPFKSVSAEKSRWISREASRNAQYTGS